LKKVILSVTNDLTTEQRVDKVCRTLIKLGFEPVLLGRRKRDSQDLSKRAYRTRRFRLLFEKGPLFYACYNTRLFFFLLFSKTDLIVANDLDTLMASYLASKIKAVPLVYDTHEYYTETPELVSRPLVQAIWKGIEKRIFPRLKHVYTVNESIAGIYEKAYGVKVQVVRNVPETKAALPERNRLSKGLPEDKKIILLQGAGINIQRGAEEMVQAMQYIDNAIFMVVGGGDVLEDLKRLSSELELESKIIFIPKQPLDKVREYTVEADLGVTLDKDTNPNYRYSLPNKLFDYIQAGVPVLASPLVEVKKIIERYDIGTTIDNHDPEHIADKVNWIFSDPKKLGLWKQNLKFASEALCWEKEEETLIQIYRPFA
jgi:glycosyltransferase involved in cell wall biosynthesis